MAASTRRDVPHAAPQLETLDALLQYCQETLLTKIDALSDEELRRAHRAIDQRPRTEDPSRSALSSSVRRRHNDRQGSGALAANAFNVWAQQQPGRSNDANPGGQGLYDIHW